MHLTGAWRMRLQSLEAHSWSTSLSCNHWPCQWGVQVLAYLSHRMFCTAAVCGVWCMIADSERLLVTFKHHALLDGGYDKRLGWRVGCLQCNPWKPGLSCQLGSQVLGCIATGLGRVAAKSKARKRIPHKRTKGGANGCYHGCHGWGCFLPELLADLENTGMRIWFISFVARGLMQLHTHLYRRRPGVTR